MRDPIVIDPPDFKQDAAWQECREYVDKCGGLQHADGEPNMRAAFGADPGVCSCPACGEYYWCWGNRQRCVKCSFEYPTDWWPMYSWGTSAARERGTRYKHEERMKHPYYAYGFNNPVDDPWKECKTPEWRAAIVCTSHIPLPTSHIERASSSLDARHNNDSTSGHDGV